MLQLPVMPAFSRGTSRGLGERFNSNFWDWWCLGSNTSSFIVGAPASRGILDILNLTRGILDILKFYRGILDIFPSKFQKKSVADKSYRNMPYLSKFAAKKILYPNRCCDRYRPPELPIQYCHNHVFVNKLGPIEIKTSGNPKCSIKTLFSQTAVHSK